MRSLMELVSLVTASRDYADLLEVMAEECRRALQASTVSLSVWERDRGTVRTLVNAGALIAGQEARPDTVLVDAVTADLRHDDPAWRLRPLPPRAVRGIGLVRPVSLQRAPEERDHDGAVG